MRLGTYYRYLVIQKLCLPVAGNAILDIGGYDGFILSRVSGQEKTLIDVSPCEEHPGINYLEGDFLAFDFREKSFSTVLAFDVLEHVQADGRFLEKMIGLLSPGGKAVLSVPCKHIRVFPYLVQPWVDKKWQHTLRRGYTREEIDGLMPEFPGDHSHETLSWNCPVFRVFYLPFSVLWRLSPAITGFLLKATLLIDTRFRSGDKGFLFVVIRRGAP